MDHLLSLLTAPQREAVTHIEGPLLVLAGPGSGKTRVITYRIAHLLRQRVPDREILALTFTNKAADEMRGRVAELAPGKAVWVSTFHRFCARLLRRNARFVGLQENYTIYDADDSRKLLRRVLADAKLDEVSPTSPDSLASAISWAKNNLIHPDQYQSRPGHALGTLVERVYPLYQAQLLHCNAVDFDDLLLHVAALLQQNGDIRRDLDERFRYIMVDEYQDTNLAQYAIVRAISVDHPNLAVTGDPDQSIYGWRGANLHNILEFERDFPEVRVVRLERNYRSTQRILHVADTLIRHNVKRKKKELFTENGEGKPVRLASYFTHKDEADAIAQQIAEAVRAGQRRPRDFAVFYRVNALSRALELSLRATGVPYQVARGVEFFQRKEIKDVLAYLQLLNNPRDDSAFLRVINTPPRGIGKTAVARLAEYAAARGISLLETTGKCQEVPSLPARSAAKIEKFGQLVHRLVAVAAGPVEEVLGCVLAESGYREALAASDEADDEERLANIEELLTAAREFDEREGSEGGLQGFLEQASLVNDVDGWDAQTDRVTLMTLHASKGLEFPVVYIMAAEEGLLPHERSRLQPDQLEEERRLLFVGITRAMEELQISLSQYRDFRGQRKMTVPSQFLMELPRGEMAVHESDMAIPRWIPAADRMPLPPPTAPAAVRTMSAGVKLTTAAELAAGNGTPPVSADAFSQGMIVRHPQYGLGRIVALSGSAAARKATVDFASPAGRMKFVLAKSPLRPVK